MWHRNAAKFALCLLTVVLLLPGCKKRVATEEEPVTPADKNPLRITNMGGGGTQGVRGAVVRVIDLNDMNTLAKFYVDHTLTNGAPPADLQALGIDRSAQKLYEKIKEGDMVVYWNVDGTKTPNGASSTILAHPKNAPGKLTSIPVALYDGTARVISPQEFNKMSKGGK